MTLTPNPSAVLASAPITPATLTFDGGASAVSQLALVVKKSSGKKDWAWDSVRGFNGNYLGRRNSAVLVGNLWTFSLLRDGGWDEDASILPYAVDAANEVFPTGSGAAGSTIAATSSPTAGTLIEPSTVLAVTINPGAGFLDAGAPAWIFAVVSYPGANTRELAWDLADGFNPGAPFSNASNTQHFNAAAPPHWGSETVRLLRDGGWPGSPTLDVFMADTNGTFAAIG